MAVRSTMEYIMSPLNNNCTEAEEQCFLRGSCRDLISKAVSEESVKSCLGELGGSVVVSCCCKKLVAEARG
jgi:hypothetical protein